jgi:hypothetical protein
MVSANIDVFEMDYKSAISYFILTVIRHTNGPATAAVDNTTPLRCRSTYKGKKTKCGVTM